MLFEHFLAFLIAVQLIFDNRALGISYPNLELNFERCEQLLKNDSSYFSQIISLPSELFPFLTNTSEPIQVKLSNSPNKYHCPNGNNVVSEITLNENLVRTTNGHKEYFEQISFTDKNTLNLDGKLYNSKEFCIHRTSNITSLKLETCNRHCSKESPCIRRCCGGQQGIPFYNQDAINGFEYSCFPHFGTSSTEVWTPSKSNILEVSSKVQNYIAVDSSIFRDRKCKLLQLQETIIKIPSVSILGNGHLLLNLGNKSDAVETFCIDGIFCNNETSPICNSAGEVAYVYACDLDEDKLLPIAKNGEAKHDLKFRSLEEATDPSVTFEQCSTSNWQTTNVSFLPQSLFDDSVHNSTNPVRVRLIGFKNITCAHGEEERTTDFFFGNSERRDETIFYETSLHMNNIAYESQEYCIQSLYYNSISIRVCKKVCSEETPCINRCCLGSKHVNLQTFLNSKSQNFGCELPTEPYKWSPILYRNIQDNKGYISENYIQRINPEVKGRQLYFTNNQNAHSFRLLRALPHKLLQNGKLMLKVTQKTWKEIDKESYCFEPLLRQNYDGKLQFTGNPDDIILRVDLKALQRPGYIDSNPKLIASLYFIFSIFYVTIGLIFLIRTDKEPVFRLCILFCSISMALNYVALGYSRIAIFIHKQQPNYFSTCAIIGMFSNFIFLSGFFWNTIVSFEVWYSITFLTARSRKDTRIWWYCLSAFLFPGILVGTGILLDLIYPNPVFTNIIVPAYGRSRCLFRPAEAPVIYLYGPLSLLVLVNILLFLGTVWNLRKSQRTTEKMKSGDNPVKRYVLNLKLFLLMGIPWALDILTWTVIELNKPPPRWTVVADIITITQPAFVFILLIWNKDNKQYFGTKYFWFKVTVNYLESIGKNMKLLVGSCFCLKNDDEADISRKEESNDTSETFSSPSG